LASPCKSDGMSWKTPDVFRAGTGELSGSGGRCHSRNRTHIQTAQ